MTHILYVFLGGGLGAVARYGLSGAVHRALGGQFPYGTFAVNVLGCLAIGLVMSLMTERFLVNPNLRLFLTLGFLGGFTTFSAFSYETVQLLRDGEPMSATANVLGTTIVCLASTWLGTAIGKQL